MTYRDLVRPEAIRLPVYEPGKPIETVAREFGLRPREILKLASNENALGPSPKATEAARQAIAQAQLYPDGGCAFLREKLAERFGLSPEQFIVGNGSNEVMDILAATVLRAGDEAVMGAQSFIAFKLAVLKVGATPLEVPMPNLRHDLNALRDAVTERTKLLYLPSPNNPTGDDHSAEAVEALVRSLPEHVIFVFDEAYAEYLPEPPDLRTLMQAGHKILCTRTFSKVYGLAAYRVGYGYGHAELIALMHQLREPFNVNAIGQAAALAALEDDDHVQRSVQVAREGVSQLLAGCRALGLECVPSRANFILVRTSDPLGLFREMQARGVIVRPVAGYGLRDWVRVTVGTAEQNERFLSALEQHLIACSGTGS